MAEVENIERIPSFILGVERAGGDITQVYSTFFSTANEAKQYRDKYISPDYRKVTGVYIVTKMEVERVE